MTRSCTKQFETTWLARSLAQNRWPRGQPPHPWQAPPRVAAPAACASYCRAESPGFSTPPPSPRPVACAPYCRAAALGFSTGGCEPDSRHVHPRRVAPRATRRELENHPTPIVGCHLPRGVNAFRDSTAGPIPGNFAGLLHPQENLEEGFYPWPCATGPLVTAAAASSPMATARQDSVIPT